MSAVLRHGLAILCLLTNAARSLDCSEVSPEQLQCEYNCACVLGRPTNVTCRSRVPCTGGRDSVVVSFVCQYCYQLPRWQVTCDASEACRGPPQEHEERPFRVARCRVRSEKTLCLGSREFGRQTPCIPVSTKRKSVAVTLSVLAGGFGVDRFYLGYVGWGMFKLLTLGGFGVWSLIDLVLIVTGTLGPSDGSSYAVPINDFLWTASEGEPEL